MRTVASFFAFTLFALSSPVAVHDHSHDDGVTLATRADGTKVACPRQLVACMDPRINIDFLLQELKLSATTSYIVRNAGGRVKEALRSVIVSQKFLGTSEVYVVHHTDCGMANNSEEGMRQAFYKKEDPIRTFMANEMEFLPIRTTNYTESVLNDVALVNHHPLLNSTKVAGYVYNIGTGGKDVVQQAEMRDNEAVAFGLKTVDFKPVDYAVPDTSWSLKIRDDDEQMRAWLGSVLRGLRLPRVFYTANSGSQMFFNMRAIASLFVLVLSVVASPVVGHDHSHDDGLALATRTDGTRVAVVTCMDPRIDVDFLLKQLKLTSTTSYIIRNAGGRAKEALRSVMVSQEFLGTSEVYVVHHTGCGMGMYIFVQVWNRVSRRFQANNSEEGMRKAFYKKDNLARTLMVNEMEFLPIRTTVGCSTRSLADS
ncbi:carbonic anhydrase [Rhizoctonia solani AG-3 Rhs1AP]|uniref:Carbonic anhydrase n=2 Tax=Rhizoctonia solani AG-3 TaxID=1086053 RepID=A0A074RZZ1_9AGAM|nr:carbonic anhydrase [Rhizoctonia solani AG-3 Rhs1AP]KEP50865.1 carbonic anhydrase [Rhizoctonia solani 123E]